MVGSNFGIIYHPRAGDTSSQANTSGSTASGVNTSNSFNASSTGERSAPASHLSDFMLQLEDYTPLMPDAVTSHYLNMGGFHADDKRIVRLISIATQKFMSDVIDDALQHSKARTHMQTAATPGGSKAKDRKFTLTMEDLQPALADYGINVRKMDYMHAISAKRLLPHQPTVANFDPDEDADSTAIEAAALDIPSLDTDQALQKAFWERFKNPLKRFEPTIDGRPELRFEILAANIMPSESVDPKVKRFVVYELTVRQDTDVIDEQPIKIHRRYTDFRELYKCLKREHPTELGNRNFPSKVLVGNFSSQLIAERSAAFESFLRHVASQAKLRESESFLRFLQHEELTRACQYLDERRNEMAIPMLENCFRLLNKVYMNRSHPVLLILCRLVAACTASPVPHHAAERWALVALSRFDTLCDVDLLQLYIPLLHTCAHLWWQRGQDQKPITDRLTAISRQGTNTANITSLMQAIHKIDPRTETI